MTQQAAREIAEEVFQIYDVLAGVRDPVDEMIKWMSCVIIQIQEYIGGLWLHSDFRDKIAVPASIDDVSHFFPTEEQAAEMFEEHLQDLRLLLCTSNDGTTEDFAKDEVEVLFRKIPGTKARDLANAMTAITIELIKVLEVAWRKEEDDAV